MTSLSESSSPSPTSVSGCVLWLDAADSDSMTVAAGKVSQWRDKSGLNNHATSPSSIRDPTLTANALNNRSVMTFSGSQNFTGPLSLGTTFTQFIVYFNSAGRIGQGLMDSNDAGILGKLAFQEGGSECFQSGFGFSYQRFFKTGATYRILMNKCSNPSSSATVSHWFNGTNENIGTGIWNFYGANSTAITSITIGARGDLIYFIGTIAEIIIYNSAISLTDQRQIEGYLAWKWGLQGSLPVGHPNYTVSGFSSPPFPLFALPTSAFKVMLNPSFFTPTLIAGCRLWLDAADSSTVTGTSNVTAWRDKISSLTLTGSGSTYTTVSGYPTITFNGNQFVSSTNIPYEGVCTSNANFTTFIIQSTSSSSGVNGLPFTIILPDNARRLAVFSNGGGSGGIFIDGASQASPRLGGITQTLNTPQILCITRKNITTMTARLNGSQVSTSDFPGTTDFISSSSYFVYISNGSGPWSGNMYEIIHYNRDMLDSEIQQIEGYLAWKWGIKSLLPGAHPNYSVNGYTLAPFPLSVLPTTPFKIQFFAPITTTFSYTGADQTYVVPAGVTRITVYLWAGGGQGTTTPLNGSYYGGAGAYVQGILTVTPGETLTVYVAQGGTAAPTFAYKNGGYNGSYAGGGTGGGRSGIARSSTNIVAVGAGGGGGGNGNGGAGGISSGSAGTGTNPGGGGTQSAGGSAGSSSFNTGGVGQLFGGGTGPNGQLDYYGGSGGDGYYGGGGGAAFGSGQLGGGGGGGSSLTSNLTSLVTFVSSNGYSAPNTSSPYYTSNIAAGGLGTSGTAGNGLVVILYSN